MFTVFGACFGSSEMVMVPFEVFMVAVYVAFSSIDCFGGDDQVFPPPDAEAGVSAAAVEAAELEESDDPQPASTGATAIPTMAVVARSRLMRSRIPVMELLERHEVAADPPGPTTSVPHRCGTDHAKISRRFRQGAHTRRDAPPWHLPA